MFFYNSNRNKTCFDLREEDRFPIFTFTAYWHMGSEHPVQPSPDYLEKIILGLKETYNLDNEEILNYLAKKRGVKGKFKKDELASQIKSAKLEIK